MCHFLGAITINTGLTGELLARSIRMVQPLAVGPQAARAQAPRLLAEAVLRVIERADLAGAG